MNSTPSNITDGDYYDEGHHWLDNESYYHIWEGSSPTKSPDMIFNDGHVITVSVYSVFMVVSVIGNFLVLYNIIR